MERTDSIVIGAGVVGLAIARALAQTGREVIIVEAESAIGMHTSSRNTGCIHAGINYPPGSLKGQLCRRGKELLYAYCADHNIGHRNCGKFLVAVEESSVPRLQQVKERAEKNGLLDLEYLDPAQVREMEPELHFSAVLHSPSSGIVDQHDLMDALLADTEDAGASLALNSPVKGGRVTGNGIELDIGSADPMTIRTDICVNAGGHWATEIAKSINGIAKDSIPEVIFAKGSYFVLPSKKPFSRLIYPLPGEHDHAVHVSPDIAGAIRFGPDTEFIDEIDYRVNPDRVDFFYEAAKRFWPAIQKEDLAPGYAGIRPKLSRERATDIDFLIQDQTQHGVPGLACLYGLESPGLTSSLAIGEYVTGILT